MKIQVLFGSERDERVFGPLCRLLEKNGEVKMQVASAHRHPEKVREIVLSDEADVFVAGAGLAAHLPGVVASMTKKPVFGVAVNGAFAGLDAFLSIVQMPSGVPVVAVTENNLATISDVLEKMKKMPKDKICLHWNRNMEDYSPVHNAIQEIEKQTEVPVVWTEALDEKCWGEVVSPWELPKGQGVHMLLCEKEQLASSHLALDFFAKAKHGGAWVGANNINNYVLQWKKSQNLGV